MSGSICDKVEFGSNSTSREKMHLHKQDRSVWAIGFVFELFKRNPAIFNLGHAISLNGAGSKVLEKL